MYGLFGFCRKLVVSTFETDHTLSDDSDSRQLSIEGYQKPTSLRQNHISHIGLINRLLDIDTAKCPFWHSRMILIVEIKIILVLFVLIHVLPAVNRQCRACNKVSLFTG